MAKTPEDKKAPAATFKGKDIFVGSLSYETTEKELEAFFRSCGTVVKVTVLRDRDTGRSKGVGFVEMNSEVEAREAVKNLHGRALGGRKIFLGEAKPKETRMDAYTSKPGFVERRSGKDRRKNPPAAGRPPVRRAWTPKGDGPRGSSFGGPKKWSKDKPGFPAKKKWEKRPSSGSGEGGSGDRKPWSSGPKKWSKDKPGFTAKRKWEKRPSSGSSEGGSPESKPPSGGKKKWTPKPGVPSKTPWSRQPPGRFAKKPGGPPKKRDFKSKSSGPKRPGPKRSAKPRP